MGLNHYEDIKDTIGIATIVNNLGVSYMGLGDLDKSLEFFNKSYTLAQKMQIKPIWPKSSITLVLFT